jgi:endoribonuclease Dicer
VFGLLTVHRYQLEALERVMHGNTVAFLETGAGKTLIAVLLLCA